MNGIRIRINYEDESAPVFVEIENDAGESIPIGEMIKEDEDGIGTIRITAADIEGVSFSR